MPKKVFPGYMILEKKSGKNKFNLAYVSLRILSKK